MQPRPIFDDEVPFVAQLWFDGWQDAHAGILPAELAKHRTLASFIDRLRTARDDAFVVGPAGTPLGFYLLDGDELNQFYVSSHARGTGVSKALLHDAESRLSQRGVTTAWLACAIGNDRAARFYEKHGWHCDGVSTIRLLIADGYFDLEIWRYTKALQA